jgi:clan AA aspartic protease (TIGR02281 family)
VPYRLPAGVVLALVALSISRTAAAQHAAAPTGHVPTDRSCVLRSRVSDCIGPGSVEHRRFARTHAIPLYGDGTHLVVNGRLNSLLSGLMLVDTGASYCVLTRAAAHSLGLTLAARSTVPVTTANGRVVADLVQLDSLAVEDASLRRVDAVIMDAVDPPLIGIIGLSFLNHFRYSVDHARGTIQLER